MLVVSHQKVLLNVLATGGLPGGARGGPPTALLGLPRLRRPVAPASHRSQAGPMSRVGKPGGRRIQVTLGSPQLGDKKAILGLPIRGCGQLCSILGDGLTGGSGQRPAAWPLCCPSRIQEEDGGEVLHLLCF